MHSLGELVVRVLPAYAGMIRDQGRRNQDFRRAPRVCGDDPKVIKIGADLSAVLPAYAGMIREARGFPRKNIGAPRVCGDDPAAPRMPTRASWCSPRMRG